MVNTSGAAPGDAGPCGSKDGPYSFDDGQWSIGPSGPGRGPEDQDGEE